MLGIETFSLVRNLLEAKIRLQNSKGSLHKSYRGESEFRIDIMKMVCSGLKHTEVVLRIEGCCL